MNAKKIMGAVLVALLAAALFVGAGAAAITADVDGKTVFVNQKLDKVNYSGNWVGPNGAYTPAVVPGAADKVYFGAAGTYTAKVGDNTVTINVKAPELAIAGVADDNTYTFIPGNFYQGEAGKIFVENPSGLRYTLYYDNVPKAETTGSQQITVPANAALGEHTLQAEFNANDFVPGTTPEQLVTAKVTFSVVDAETAVTISAAETTVLKSDAIKLTVTGQPGVTYKITYDTAYAFTVGTQIGFSFNNIDAGQKTGIEFTMPAGGKATFDVKANLSTKLDTSEKIFAQAKDVQNAKKASVTINFMKGTISAQADASSYFVGDEITITGTSTAGAITSITIEGTNFESGELLGDEVTGAALDSNNAFEFELNTADVYDDSKKLDVGTYTLTIKTDSGAETIVALVLKQPFISIAKAPEVVVQGKDAEFVVNAEATDNIAYYVFGTNYFYYSDNTANVEDEDGQEISNMFKFEIDGDITANLSLGQYFVVVQHPMYDGKFQIVSGYPTNWTILGANGASIVPINVKDRQTANAAQALCDALDVQGIDDMYVKASFFIVGEDATSTMSELPTEVVKGETIVISGVDTSLDEGTVVTAQMLSTAFAAVPKETVGSAAFIVVSTKVAEDGTWELTLDTSDLNVDEYSLSVAIDGINKKSVTVNVVEADEPVNPEQPEEPEQPEQPEEPVAPATPGFGALAALAGLGAVAVLLLRRE